MSIAITCPECEKRYNVGDQLAGKRVKCKACGAVMQIPQAEVIETSPFDDADYATPVAIAPVIPPPSRPTKRAAIAPSYAPKAASSVSQKSIVRSVLLGVGVLVLGGMIWLIVSALGRAKSIGRPTNEFVSGPTRTAHPVFPPRPNFRTISAVVRFAEVQFNGHAPAEYMKLWIYLPENPMSKTAMPCVFIAPAGTNTISGMTLGDGDRPEHLPYVRAGFAVVAYELDGEVSGGLRGATEAKLGAAVKAFAAADGGLLNARVALDYVRQTFPEIDANKLYAAGHSSAANIAILLLEKEPRIRAAAAYAPACGLISRFLVDAPKLERSYPGITEFLNQNNPTELAGKLHGPLFMFHADDDTTVLTSDNVQFVEKARAAGKKVEFVQVPTGGHHQSMIDQGITGGIKFLKQQASGE